MNGINIQRFSAARRPALNGLLAASGLPSDDIREADLPEFVVALDASDELIAAAGVEDYGRDALLRSVAVAPAWRGRGIAAALVRAVEVAAHSRQVEAIYLLTDTAESFFAAHGYMRCAREEVPPGVQAGRQFSSSCPKTATVMCKSLGEN